MTWQPTSSLRTLFHRAIWQHLPRRARRAALFSLSRRVAPVVDLDARPTEPFVVVGCFRSATGLGESARLCYEALSTEGLDVWGIDVSSVLMQPIDYPDYPYRDGRSMQGRGTLLVHVNAPLMPLVFFSLGRRIIRDKFVIGYWAWELPVIPPEWKYGLSLVHEIWVPSQFVAAAVAPSVINVPVRVLPHPVACRRQNARAPAHKSSRPFTALVVFDMGSSMERKNPSAAITAFRTAFVGGSNARMIVKVMNASFFPEGEQRLRAAAEHAGNVTIIDGTLNSHALARLYEEADCLVSLHRSEGFGLVVAEAMLHGIPALSTNWSGTTDFVTAENGCPVEYQLVPARDPQHTYNYSNLLWAEPDVAVAAKKLQELYADAGEYGERARDDALQRFSAGAYAASVQHFFALSNDRNPADHPTTTRSK